MLSPTTQLIINAADITLALIYNVYLFSSLFLKSVRKPTAFSPANLFWYWTKWPALASVILHPPLTILLDGKLSALESVLAVASGVVWWLYRNAGDDNDHKKLKKKLKEKVAVLDGKLSVVPEPA